MPSTRHCKGPGNVPFLPPTRKLRELVQPNPLKELLITCQGQSPFLCDATDSEQLSLSSPPSKKKLVRAIYRDPLPFARTYQLP